MLIPLKDINFVSTKIEVNPIVTYSSSSSGITGEVYDKSYYSKNIVNSKKIVFPELVGINQQNVFEAQNLNSSRIELAKVFFANSLDIFSNPFSNKTEGENYLDFQDLFYKSDLGNTFAFNPITIDKDDFNFRESNFKNSFGINLIEQRFLFEGTEISKKKYVKNILYKHYRENISSDNLSNIYWGFSNYNTLNFYNLFDGQQNKHSNCLIYPNLKNIYEENAYPFVTSNSFNVSFYINVRKKNSNNNGCILHVPGLIDLYLQQGDTFDEKGDTTGYKLGYVNGNSTIVNSPAVTTINNSNNTDYLFYNNWHSVSINVLKERTNFSIFVYIDGEIVSKNTNVDLSGIHTIGNNAHSFIAIGNKPTYEANAVQNVEDYFKIYFCHSYGANFAFNGPFKNKHIIIPFYENRQSLLKTSVNVVSAEFFNKCKISKTHGLEAEISDFRIYKNIIPNDKIKEICSKGIKNISSEKEEFGLCFYTPFYFVPFKVGKNAIKTANSEKGMLGYSSFLNPQFANTCGGLEVSVENFVSEWVKKSSPNIVIGGQDKNNIVDDKYNESVDSYVNLNNDNAKIKKGYTVNNIYSTNFDNSSSTQQNNLSYRNYMILPNDNGLQEQFFETIHENWSLEISDSLSMFNTGIVNLNINRFNNNNTTVSLDKFLFEREYYNVSCENVNLGSVNVSNEISTNRGFYLRSREITNHSVLGRENIDLFLVNNESALDYFSLDNFKNINFEENKRSNNFNLSNLIFHSFDNFTIANNIENATDNIDNITINNRTNTFNLADFLPSMYKKSTRLKNLLSTNSNTIVRNYKSTIQLYNDAYFSKSIDIISEDIYYYKFNDVYVRTETDSSSLFSIIIDISTQLYNKKIKKGSFNIKDNAILGSKGKINFSLKDNERGSLYRADCLTKQAKWNYVGHIFYKEGIATLHHPALSLFGIKNHDVEFISESNFYVHEVNVPCESSLVNKSLNDSYEQDVRISDSVDDDENFVFISGINLHDENLNIVSRTKFSQPVSKKDTDNILFRLKMDY